MLGRCAFYRDCRRRHERSVDQHLKQTNRQERDIPAAYKQCSVPG
jgi:hypothetical protein